jgi:hypothetical protein
MKMKLPMIETPKYLLTLPISNTTIEYRPYLIGEELEVIHANEMKDDKNIVNSFFNTVKKCILTENVDVETLPLVDFFYILLHIRAKSVKEDIDVNKTCAKCEKDEPYSFNILETLFIDNIKNTKKIVDLGNKLQVELQPAKANFIRTLVDSSDKNQFILSSLATTINKVFVDSNIYSDIDPEDLKTNFISKLTQKQIKLIADGVQALPVLKCKVTSVCSHCGNEEEFIIEDILDFLN